MIMNRLDHNFYLNEIQFLYNIIQRDLLKFGIY